MKLFFSEDEKYPYVFVKVEGDLYTEHMLERDVPDDLGREFVELRKREQKLLKLFAVHFEESGQPQAYDFD